ncbi:Membrane protein involved in the export of O-antigen and teichoic acid [Butyrivibrio fibrisolvens DSM 3071]|uniref:Membrane protein involved in the export of O-antigen and teichoic acid n=1 Tax=Butyrivibrio fibrisolvens DSM 3071 TaxID=1121131 RepID=A0A1M6FMS1_BUTFI|nr:oligosaccharide flippase family protein [Butyrivibrio fibrisolvens]SHI98974.1 Membrane protein involved in the export of O-antigen and teichoic acid [Butyrivibrio fibrisolvens DSM 3071]
MSSLKKNLSYNIIYQIFTIMMPLITAPYLSRIIGVSGIGMYSYTFTVAEYFVFFALLGVSNYGNRTIAGCIKDNRNRTFINIYATQLSVSLIVILAYIIYIFFIVKNYKALAAIQLLYVLSAGADVTWYFFGTEKFKLTTIRTVIIKLISLILIFAFVRDYNDIWKYTLIMAGGYLVSQLIMWPYVIAEIKYQKPVISEMKIHLKNMIILFIPVIAITVYKMMDKIMLEAICDVNSVGFYESAEKIVKVPAYAIVAIGTAMLPRMSKLGHENNKTKMLEYFGLSVELSGFLIFGMAFGLMAIAKFLVPIYYGKDFEYSIILLETLSFSLLFTTWASAIRTQYLIPLKHDKEYIVSVCSGAIVNLILNSVLIPLYGAYGAVIATISAEGAVAFIQTIAVRNELPIFKPFVKYIRFIIPAFSMYLIVCFCRPYLTMSIFSIIILVCIGGTVYCLFAVMMMYICNSELLSSVYNHQKKHSLL